MKAWLKIPSSVTTDDDIVDALIKSARVYAEQTTNKALFTQTIQEYYDCWQPLESLLLSVGPVQSVTSVEYLSSGTYTTWASSNYYTDIVTEPGRIICKMSVIPPAYDMNAPNAIRVTYVVGWSSTSLIPDTIKDAMLQRIAYQYENREDIPMGGGSAARQRSADHLLMKNRRFI